MTLKSNMTAWKSRVLSPSQGMLFITFEVPGPNSWNKCLRTTQCIHGQMAGWTGWWVDRQTHRHTDSSTALSLKPVHCLANGTAALLSDEQYKSYKLIYLMFRLFNHLVEVLLLCGYDITSVVFFLSALPGFLAKLTSGILQRVDKGAILTHPFSLKNVPHSFWCGRNMIAVGY